jgi:predicted RNA methylase
VLAADFIESRRVQLQNSLDSTKTQAERNRLGQFATPAALATDILAYAKSLVPSAIDIRFLDPAFGTGSFYSALLRSFSPSRVVQARGYEIDPHYGLQAKRLWVDTALTLNVEDFTRATPPASNDAKATLVVCNPPYVRHHHVGRDEKMRLQRMVEERAGVRLTGLAGLYCYFVCLSHEWMAEDGLAVWLIPSEFMDVKYGEAVKQYLLSRVTLLRIHRFDPTDVQFGDALVSSAVVSFKKAAPPDDYAVDFSYGGTLANPKITRRISVGVLKRAAKWSRLPLASDEVASRGKQTKLADLFHVKRGLATGANGFFVLTPQQVSENHLPAEFVRPILPSPRYLPVDEIEADSMGNPILDRSLFLLTCNLPEDYVRATYPTLWKYLQTGVAKGINKRYLCQHRSPWYSQENRPASPFLCTYMGRRGVRGEKAFRFILNHSRATAPNVYLMLYPKPTLKEALRGRPERVNAVWHALDEIPMETLLGEGRVYGGGLHKLEPRELANAPAGGVLEVVPELFSARVGQPQLL